MATLGQSLSTAGVTSVYTVPATKTATFSISLCNTGSTSQEVLISIGSGATPDKKASMFYATLGAKSSLERTGLRASEGYTVFVTAENSDIAVNVYGYEE